MKIYIFGIGEGKSYLDRCLQKEIEICGYIDNYKAAQLSVFQGKPVIQQNELSGDYDFIIITLMKYETARDDLLAMGIASEKILCFFDFKDASNERNWDVINGFQWRLELMWKHYTEITMPYMDNIDYELYWDSELIKKECPKILSVEDTVRILQKERKCLARFGDGEFELMLGRPRPHFQSVDNELSKRLKEVLNSDEKNLLIAIADNYGSLDKYTDEAARDIRMYMTKEVRKGHMQLLDLSRSYHNAFLSRPYLIFRDKKNAKKRFDHIKDIWSGENVLIVEGEHTRFGVGNDLIKSAKSIKRILVPDRNAFEKYEKIKDAVCQYGQNKLVLAVIGPTATVLAYDLAKMDYWIIDIGQLDTEYEWFLRKTDIRCSIQHKNVSEVTGYEPIDDFTEDDDLRRYNDEIIMQV